MTWSRFVALAAVSAITACATPDAPTHAEIANEVTIDATVHALDATTREVTLEREDGSRFSFVAGPEVRNFDRIEVGDTVRTRYIESLSARRLGPEEPTAEPVAAAAGGRAEPGEDPGVAIGVGAALTVRVQSVDQEEHLVVFTGPSGRLEAVRAKREEGQRFVAGLKPGDRVELVFGKAMALTLEKPGS